MVSIVQRWIQEGIKEGREQGIEQGREEGIISIAKKMLKDKEPTEKISKYTGLKEKPIEELQKQLKNEK